MLTDAQWQAYRNVVNQASESFNQEVVVWRRHTRGFQRYGEDNVSNENYTDINLNALISYNIFRTWPISKGSEGGLTDKESIVMILNKNYLEGLGYLNGDGFFNMDPGKDIFIHRGLIYKASGETEVASAGGEALMYYIVLVRQEVSTGEQKY